MRSNLFARGPALPEPCRAVAGSISRRSLSPSKTCHGPRVTGCNLKLRSSVRSVMCDIAVMSCRPGHVRGHRSRTSGRSNGCRRCAEPLEQRRRADRRETDITLHAVEQRGAREVARADAGRVETGVSCHLCLGMEMCAKRVVLHLDVGAGVGDRAVTELGELLLHEVHVVPFHEGQDDARPVSAWEFCLQLRAYAGLALGTGEPCSLRCRCRRAAQRPRRLPRCRGRGDSLQLAGA